MKVPFATLVPLHNELRSGLDEVYQKVMLNSYYIGGAFLTEFEKAFATYCGTKNAVGCGNGLDAISIGLRALGVGEGDEVIVPSFTFIATALAVVYAGATPVFVDVDQNALIDIDKIEQAITAKTRAIVPVHLYGRAVDMPRLTAIAQKHNLFVVEDCAQAHGAQIDGKKVGSFGNVGAFSFYPGKNLGALGDAGAMVFSDERLCEPLRAIGNYGSMIKYQHDYVGVNSRLDELQAGFLGVKLSCLDKINEARRDVVKKYLKGINNQKILLPVYPKNPNEHVWHVFVVRSEERDRLHDYLAEKGIITLSHYPIAMNKQRALEGVPMYQKDFINAERFSRTVLSLPLYYGMTDAEIDYVIDAVNAF